MTMLNYLPQCGSTNDEVVNFLRPGSAEIAGLCTFFQNNGRGQYGNRWEGAAGKNIALSLAVPASSVKLSDSLFNYYTALNIRRFTANLTRNEVKIKWPNDLIISHKKVCGILIEKKKVNNRMYYIVGIGLNVLQEDFGDLPRAGSLLTQTGTHFNLTDVAESMYTFLLGNFSETAGPEGILQDYNSCLYKRNEVAVFRKDNISQNGMISKADEDGNLWVELEHGGLQKFYHKEIEMLY